MKKIENQIRQQLENREIPVSENAWGKLSGMMEKDERTLSGAGTAKKQLKNWRVYAAAASIVILISLFVLNPFGGRFDSARRPHFDKLSMTVQESQNEEPDFVTPNSGQKNEMISEEIPAEIAEVKNEFIQPENQKIHLKSNSAKKEEFSIQNKMEIVQNPVVEKEISKPELNLKLPEPEVPQEIASTGFPETKQQTEKKKNKYVDAGMLLYSVENNQTISESRDNSRLVIIDFNK